MFSFDDLLAAPGKRTCWDGVRNYQARNLLRDDIQKGDGVLYYHSNAKPMVIAGVAKVVKAGYPDHHALDPEHRYYDAKSKAEDPTWYMVDIQAVKKFKEPLERQALMGIPALKEMVLLQRGSRLSVQPVRKKEWQVILKEAGVADPL